MSFEWSLTYTCGNLYGISNISLSAIQHSPQVTVSVFRMTKKYIQLFTIRGGKVSSMNTTSINDLELNVKYIISFFQKCLLNWIALTNFFEEAISHCSTTYFKLKTLHEPIHRMEDLLFHLKNIKMNKMQIYGTIL